MVCFQYRQALSGMYDWSKLTFWTTKANWDPKAKLIPLMYCVASQRWIIKFIHVLNFRNWFCNTLLHPINFDSNFVCTFPRSAHLRLVLACSEVGAASGLLWIAELIEEHTVTAKVVGIRGTYVCPTLSRFYTRLTRKTGRHRHSRTPIFYGLTPPPTYRLLYPLPLRISH